MRIFLLLTITAIITNFSLNSCSVQKRLHLPGYHVSWKGQKYKANEKIILDNLDESEYGNSINTDVSESPTIKFKKSFEAKILENESIESKNQTHIISNDKLFLTNTKNKINSFKILPKLELKNVISDKLVFKNIPSDLTKYNNSKDNDSGNVALRVIGWIVLILGILLLLFASIIIGALLMLLGLIFVIAGAKKNNSSKDKNEKSEYVDVVYLKNGSVIRGVIIEQIPNVSLKIKTKDESIFVYRMEEIEKISKEISK